MISKIILHCVSKLSEHIFFFYLLWYLIGQTCVSLFNCCLHSCLIRISVFSKSCVSFRPYGTYVHSYYNWTGPAGSAGRTAYRRDGWHGFLVLPDMHVNRRKPLKPAGKSENRRTGRERFCSSAKTDRSDLTLLMKTTNIIFYQTKSSSNYYKSIFKI